MMIHDGFPKRIDEQIDDYAVLPDFSVKDANNAVILTSNDVSSYMYNMYGNYKTVGNLWDLWRLYEGLHHADFLKAWAAWNDNYNPLENYNGTETTVRMKQDGTETERITHGKTITNSTGTGGVVNETQTTSVDSEAYRADTKNIQTGSTTNAETGTTTTTHETSEKSLSIGGETYTADYVEGETKSRHGNLGVTTSQQMIESEMNMRLNPLTIMYIDTFISEYAYYFEGGFSRDNYYL